MTCDKCEHFKVLYEPLRTKGELWDMGKAECAKHNLETDFSTHGKFKRLSTCEDFEPKKKEAKKKEARTKRYIAVLEIEDDCKIVGSIEATVSYTYRSNGTNYATTESVEFKAESEI